MNVEYETQGNELIVIDQIGRKTKREITNNFKEILITENNIEEIKNLINAEEINQADYKKNIKRKGMLPLINFNLWLSAAILYLCSADIILGCTYVVISSFWGLSAYVNSNQYLKLLKASKKWTAILEEQLENEKSNLKELQNDKENNLNFQNEISGEVPYSKKIVDLKTKLDMFNYYFDHKKACLKAYKNGYLKQKVQHLFDENDLLLLEELIINDLYENTQVNKEKQKVLTNKKNIRKF